MESDWAQKQLLTWSVEHGQQYPWRDPAAATSSMLVGEMLLQRLLIDAALAQYHRFVNRFPNWNAIASAELTVLHRYLPNSGIWRKRAISFNYLAKQLSAELTIAPTQQALEELPGFSYSIANWVRIVVFGAREPFLDKELARVIGRFHRINYHYRFFEQQPQLVQKAYAMTDHPTAITLNCAIRDLANAICLPAQPQCLHCPLQSHCATNRVHQQ